MYINFIIVRYLYDRVPEVFSFADRNSRKTFFKNIQKEEWFDEDNDSIYFYHKIPNSNLWELEEVIGR